MRRSEELTAALKDGYSLKELWDDYGIVGELEVWKINSDNTNLILNQPFTTSFEGADIHELLTPDLLHQIIKGTFKDHLVTWVEQYLKAKHGEAQANEILADIDRR